VRNRLTHQRPTLRRLPQTLTLAAALAGGVLPTTAAIADGTTTAQTALAQPAAVATWSLVATLDPAHVQTPSSVLTLYGVYAFTPILVNFNPKVLPASINQSVVPQYAVPDDSAHTYKVVFHLTTDVTASGTTSYQFRSQPRVTIPIGDADLQFTETVNTRGWHGFTLRNATDDHWLFYRCDIYEQIS